MSSRKWRLTAGAIVWLWASPVLPLSAGVISREEALAAAYPGAHIEAETILLSEKQQHDARTISGMEIPTRLIARYVARVEGRPVGRAYVDTHIVRTKRESLLVCLDEQGAVKRIEVTAFLEPPEYQAPEVWYAQYQGKVLNDDLNVHRAIRPLAGATLTARSANQAVRRILAIDRILAGEGRRP